MYGPNVIVFDLDDTLIGSISSVELACRRGYRFILLDNHETLYPADSVLALRPYTRDVLGAASEHFDERVVWSHRGPRALLEEELDRLGIGDHFTGIIGRDNNPSRSRLWGVPFTKDLLEMASIYDTSIENVVLIQDKVYPYSAAPKDRCVFIRPFRPGKYLSRYDTTLLGAYREALSKVPGTPEWSYVR